MNKESRARGYVLTEESLNLFKKKQSELDLSLEDIAGKAGMSVDSVKRLLSKTAVQKNTVHEIAKVLEVDFADIKLIASKDVAQKISSESVCSPSRTILTNIKVSGSLKRGDFIDSRDVAQKISSESVCSPSQTILTNIKVSGSLKGGDFILKAPRGTSVEQVVLHDVYAENIELGNVTLEG